MSTTHSPAGICTTARPAAVAIASGGGSAGTGHLAGRAGCSATIGFVRSSIASVSRPAQEIVQAAAKLKSEAARIAFRALRQAGRQAIVFRADALERARALVLAAGKLVELALILDPLLVIAFHRCVEAIDRGLGHGRAFLRRLELPLEP